MHDREARLVEILNACDFDRSRLTADLYAEVFNLARAAGIELYHAGRIWPSSPGADLTGGGLTRL